MNDPVTMQIVEGLYELLRDLSHFSFAQITIIFQDFEEFALSKFSHHTELVRSLKRVEKQNYVLVVETLQNFDFLPQIVHFFL